MVSHTKHQLLFNSYIVLFIRLLKYNNCVETNSVTQVHNHYHEIKYYLLLLLLFTKIESWTEFLKIKIMSEISLIVTWYCCNYRKI